MLLGLMYVVALFVVEKYDKRTFFIKRREFRRGDGVSFGWQTITDLYKRELARVDQGCTRMVPRLKEAHCLCDAWKKLNVHPAKFVCFKHVINLSNYC